MRRVLFIAVLLLVQITWAEAQLRKYNIPGRQTTTSSKPQINYRAPQEYEIADIKVEGVEYLDHNALISISGLSVGDRIKVPGDEIAGAIKKLWSQSLLGSVSIEASKVELDKIWLVIKLTERARLTKIDFDGISRSQQTELDDKIELIRGRIITDVLLKNTELAIKRHYVEKGFLNVDVNIRQERDTVVRNGMQLVINVDRGPKVRIDNMIFEGNGNFASNRLKMKMKKTNEQLRFTLVEEAVYRLLHTSPGQVWNFLSKNHEVDELELVDYLQQHVKVNFFSSSKFIESEFDADKQALVDFYNSQGYRDAQVVADSVYDVDSRRINIAMRIEEGQKYYIRNIDWTGNYLHNDKLLTTILGMKKGDVYDLSKINQRLQYNPQGLDVSALYMDNGYLFFNVQPVEVRVAGDSVDVEMRISEGPQATINKVVIAGNDRTNDHVVMREIQTLPGQKFSRQQLIQTQQRLSQLGYFDPEQINIQPIPNPADGTVDMHYNLVERPNDQIELSGGWGGFIGFVGTVGISFNNFSASKFIRPRKWDPLPVGDGQRLSLRVQANGASYQNYSFSFTEPWLGGNKPNSLTVGVNHSVQRRFQNLFAPITGDDNPETGFFKVTGASVSLARRLKWPDDWFTLSNSLSYLLYDVQGYGNLFAFDSGRANNIILATTLSRSSVDNPIYPRSGSNWTLQVSLTPPYSIFNDKDYSSLPDQERYKWVEYHKWMFDSWNYIKLAGDLVLNARVHMGFIGAYNSNVGIGPFERFILGGDGLAGVGNFALGNDIIGLRGYANNSLYPPYGEVQSDGNRGGVVFNKYVMELRYPISLNPQATIFAVAWGEAGNNWYTHKEYNPFDLNKSAGVGARIFMPAFGLIGIDWGYGFDTLPGQSERSGSQFHFTIGQQIR